MTTLQIEIPPEGTSYLSVADLILKGVEKPTDDQRKEAIRKATVEVNLLMKQGKLCYSHHENGHAVWITEPVEPIDRAKSDETATCVNCGKTFPVPKMGNKQKKYCTGDCKDEARAKIYKTAKCAGCGRQFKSKRYNGRWTMYCTSACGNKCRASK